MFTRLRLFAVVCAVIAATVMAVQTDTSDVTGARSDVDLRSTFAPMDTPTTIKWPVIDLVDERPFDACKDIPIDAIRRIGLAFTPPTPEEGVRCKYDSGNYAVSVETIVWRSYEESLAVDAQEFDIQGHRAAWNWVMKPTDWNNRWWFSCMITFKASYGVIQQTLFFSPIYSNPDVDCPAENLRRANELTPYYIF